MLVVYWLLEVEGLGFKLCTGCLGVLQFSVLISWLTYVMKTLFTSPFSIAGFFDMLISD